MEQKASDWGETGPTSTLAAPSLHMWARAGTPRPVVGVAPVCAQACLTLSHPM